jgi:lauroyl/myristoyl acyltransferase
MKERAEYTVVRALLKILEVLPRQIARPLAASTAHVLFLLSPKLRKTAELNLRLAFPDWTETQRANVIRKMTRNLGWMAAEFARLPKYSKQNIEDVVILDGHENFMPATGKRSLVFNRPHWRMGTLFLRARSVWLPAPLHGPSAG